MTVGIKDLSIIRYNAFQYVYQPYVFVYSVRHLALEIAAVSKFSYRDHAMESDWEGGAEKKRRKK